MDVRTKKTIEWAFYNFESLNAIGVEQIASMAESGMIQPYGGANVSGGRISNPTASNAQRYGKCLNEYHWARVVENVKIAFEFEVQGQIIKDRFEKNMKFYQLVGKHGNGDENTYLYRYRKIMELAFEWACKYNLLRPEKSVYPQKFMG